MRITVLIISSLILLLGITDTLLLKYNNVYLNYRKAEKGYGSVATSDTITNPKLMYYYYIPATKPPENGFPVLVLPGGGAARKPYIISPWSDFAAKNNFVVIAPNFIFSEKDWNEEKSFQYPDAWSGNALIDVLEDMKGKTKLERNKLYLFGSSAGAQFTHRFALLHPEMCKAVTAIAPGGITLPETKIPVRFYLSVGNEDKMRMEILKEFYNECAVLGIDAVFEVIKGQRHACTEAQINKAFEFFLETRAKAE